ncbi:hypothetical protein II906_12855 [bacterium]|nr:hypothetical protein [bacterium]
MKISAINNTTYPIKKKPIQKGAKDKITIQNLSEYSAENIKAYYSPSFGNYRKIRDAYVENRTNKILYLTKISREKSRNTERYIITRNNKELGFMNFVIRSNCKPESFWYRFLQDLPKIQGLRTIEGNDFRGIGTQLVKCAVDRSKELGYEGELILSAEQGYAMKESPYRSDENPIPFYYKLGFQCIDNLDDRKCRKLISEGRIEELPIIAEMILTKDKGVPAFEAYYEKNFGPEEE